MRRSSSSSSSRAFVFDAGIESRVDLATHRADSDLDDIDLGDDGEAAA
jgi:hypothetical protein